MIRNFKQIPGWANLPLVLVTVGLLLGCHKDAPQSGAVDFGVLRQKAVEQIGNGSIKSDAGGKALLPQELKQASVDGYVYISKNENTGLLIVFPESAASPDSGEPAVLYCENQIPVNGPAIEVAGTQWRLGRPMGGNFWMVNRAQ